MPSNPLNGFSPYIKQLGVGGLIALGVLYMVFGFLKDTGVVDFSTPASASEITHQVSDIHSITTRVDTDGTYMVYKPRSATRIAEAQINVLVGLDQTVQHLNMIMESNTKALERVERKLENQSP